MTASRIESMTAELAAKEKCIQVLMDRLYNRQKGQTAVSLLEQNEALLEVVSRKTRQLEERNRELEASQCSLEETQQKLLNSSKLEAIGRLAAGVAHEINTPMQFLGDNLSFLRESFVSLMALVDGMIELTGKDPDLRQKRDLLLETTDHRYLVEEIPPALEATFSGLERVVKIVQAMRRFSHSSRAEKRPIRLEEIITNTLTVLAFDYKSVATIEANFDPELPEVACIYDELSQVLLNMLVNAAYAIRQKNQGMGVIGVSTRRLGNMARMTISDTGMGMSEDTQRKIFEPFFTTKPMGEGTGQGLAISYRVIVEKHHGALSFESELGIGTSFHIDLPLSEDVD